MSLPPPAGPRAGHSITVGSLSRGMKQHSSLTSLPCLILLKPLPEHQHNKTLGCVGVNRRLGPQALHSSGKGAVRACAPRSREKTELRARGTPGDTVPPTFPLLLCPCLIPGASGGGEAANTCRMRRQGIPATARGPPSQPGCLIRAQATPTMIRALQSQLWHPCHSHGVPTTATVSQTQSGHPHHRSSQ